jgi:hypothetical protein
MGFIIADWRLMIDLPIVNQQPSISNRKGTARLRTDKR